MCGCGGRKQAVLALGEREVWEECVGRRQGR